ncbi:FAD-dependent oxidoreductase [Candidatus Poriferisocius sp.]|uniref:oxidoreductase n=1 Tax=Candidatus Poriferisocius sp. TaxID=3101276 RepID=UPI003B02C79B
MSYEHLLAPGRIGTLELRNRLIMAPMGEELGVESGEVSDDQIAYLEARARGGMALVMLGSVAVAFPVGCSNKRQTAISDDRFIPSWERAADRVHTHGGKIAMQLTHAGKIALQDTMAGRPLWVPSVPGPATVDPLYGMVTGEEGAMMAEPLIAPGAKVHYRVMDHDDIATVVNQFAAATVRARAAGVDGVELHGGHGYLIDAFLSPTINTRDDEYGGSTQNRARFLVEILTEIRRRVGDDYPVWVRLNSTEVDIDGIVLSDAIDNARRAAAAGADAIHVSAYHDPGIATGPTDSYAPHVPELLVANAAAVKAEVDVPVIAVGRISPEAADSHIAEGSFDFLAMGRKILADPDLVNKLGAGRPDDVRPCVYHYRCIGNIFLRKGTRCAGNGFLGREDSLTAAAAPSAKKVLVVGGGPSGMETARVAALRGHEVILAEASDRLGGRWALASATSDVNAELLGWFEHQLDRLGVDVRLDTRMDVDRVSALSPHTVVVAVGGRWDRPVVEGIESPLVWGVDDLAPWLLDGIPLNADRVTVLGGDLPGLGVTEAAHRQGAEVTLIESGPVLGHSLGLPGRWRVVNELSRAGVNLITGAEVVAITGEGVVWRSNGTEQTTPTDRVVVTSDPVADHSLVDELRAAGAETHTVGDCAQPGFLEGAMRSAVELAANL